MTAATRRAWGSTELQQSAIGRGSLDVNPCPIAPPRLAGRRYFSNFLANSSYFCNFDDGTRNSRARGCCATAKGWCRGLAEASLCLWFLGLVGLPSSAALFFAPGGCLTD